MKINKIFYPDGSFYPQIIEFSSKLVFNINSYNDLWYLKQIKDVLDFNKVQVDLLIPCLLDAQGDDRFNDNESFNLKLICEFINDMNWKSVSIFHPHNISFVKAIINNITIINNVTFIESVLNIINNKDLVFISPDAGAYKWINKLRDALNWKGKVINASKSREWKDNESIITQELSETDLKGQDCIIIDDLMQYGGTFKGLSKMLKERNCGKLYLAISHMTVQNLGEDPVTDHFDKVFTTNSKYEEYCCEYDIIQSKKIKPKNLEIIKLF